MLSAACPSYGGYGHRGLAPYRPDEEPGGPVARLLPGLGKCGPFPEFFPAQAPGGRGPFRPSFGQDEAPVPGTGVAEQGREHRPAQGAEDILLRRGRGPLHIGMGARLPSRVQAHTQNGRYHRPLPDYRPHGDSHSQGPERHPQEPRHPRRKGVQDFLQPPEPLL